MRFFGSFRDFWGRKNLRREGLKTLGFGVSDPGDQNPDFGVSDLGWIKTPDFGFEFWGASPSGGQKLPVWGISDPPGGQKPSISEGFNPPRGSKTIDFGGLYPPPGAKNHRFWG